MVNLRSAELDLLFYALSDPTRREILRLTGERTRTISELADPFKMSLPAISKHIKILETAQLLTRKLMGRIHECTLNASSLKAAEECIQFYTRFWNQRLDLLAQHLERKSHVSRKSK